MSTLTLNHFAQPIALPAPLPPGPVLWLPSGGLDVQDNGRLFAFARRWIVAVGLSEKVFLVVRQRSDRYFPGNLLHELMGYLVACGADIIPLDYRCPLSWRQGSSLASIGTLWASEFFATSKHLLFEVPLPLSDDPRLHLPLESLAMDGAMFWQDVHAVATAVFNDPLIPAGPLRSQLNQISKTWELRWNETLALAGPNEFERDKHSWVMRCDTFWRNVVKVHLEPHGYQIMPATTARML